MARFPREEHFFPGAPSTFSPAETHLNWSLIIAPSHLLPRGLKRPVLLSVLGAGVGLIALTYYQFGGNSLSRTLDNQPPEKSRCGLPEDPRLTFSTPYRNVRPEVKYVGDAACARCHGQLVEAYHQHPMGRSVARAGAEQSGERYDEAAHNPFRMGHVTYKVTCAATGMSHSETVLDPGGQLLTEMTAPIAFVMGSGRNGRAFLVERAGSFVASPITWYPKKKQWDLSPGYEKQNPHFGRPITADCLFCHVNAADPVPGGTNRYRSAGFPLEPIGCERCHGPGELHVARHEKAEPFAGGDDTIVNPARLEHMLRESVCQQCHLQGQQRVLRPGLQHFDFRPGLPLSLFSTEFIKPAQETETKFVGSVEQMYSSQCFQKSTGTSKLGCISCHDPHRLPAPERKVAFYRERCLNCHQDKGCNLPPPIRLKQSPEDNCVACHMPPTGSNINHTTISDHRILRNPEAPKSTAAVHSSRHDFPLISFPPQVLTAADRGAERSLAIALVQYANSLPSGAALRALLERAVPMLDAALAREEHDLAALEARGNALWFLGRLDEALETYESVLKQSPDQELVLYQAATLSLRLSKLLAARSYAQRAIDLNPWRWEYHQVLARVYAQDKDWVSSMRSCQEALKLNALEPGTNRHLVLCHVRLGDRAQAQKAFETLLLLIPAQTDELRRWYAQLSP